MKCASAVPLTMLQPKELWKTRLLLKSEDRRHLGICEPPVISIMAFRMKWEFSKCQLKQIGSHVRQHFTLNVLTPFVGLTYFSSSAYERLCSFSTLCWRVFNTDYHTMAHQVVLASWSKRRVNKPPKYKPFKPHFISVYKRLWKCKSYKLIVYSAWKWQPQGQLYVFSLNVADSVISVYTVQC